MQGIPSGRRCTVCESPARALVDGALLSGDSVVSIYRTIGKAAGMSSAALYRHSRNAHHAPRRFASAGDGESVGDIVRSLVATIDHASAVRDEAHRRKADAIVLRASAEVRAASVALAERLGIDETSVADELRYGEELRVVVRLAALDDPTVADALARTARRVTRHELADDAEALAALSRTRKANHD